MRVVEVANHHSAPCGVDHVSSVRVIAQSGRDNRVPDSMVQLHSNPRRLIFRYEVVWSSPWRHDHGFWPRGRGERQGVLPVVAESKAAHYAYSYDSKSFRAVTFFASLLYTKPQKMDERKKNLQSTQGPPPQPEQPLALPVSTTQ